MIYRDAIEYLGQARRFGMKLGLEPMRDLARALGDPQEKLRFIHLAGTNGKGSTAAFCESILRAAGFRVGLYTSPHLVSVRERIQIDRVPISEADITEGMAVIQDAVKHRSQQEPTFFEIMTALALWYFGREKVDWVVWETGLGGRLDATNIVQPEVCIITNIGLEHQQYLGSTLAEIAAEKAGIIKPGAIVVSAVALGEASGVIDARAREERCGLTLIHRDAELKDLGLSKGKQVAMINGQSFTLGMTGPHQVENAACAVEAMRQLGSDEYLREDEEFYFVEDRAIARGLESAFWPGRFEVISGEPLIVLDGAHNPAAVKMLVETWRAFLSERFGWSGQEIEGRARLIFASVADKDISEMAALLRPVARDVSLVRLANERSADPQSLAPAFAGLPCSCFESVADVWKTVENSAPESITLVTGSLFLVGEMLARRRGNAEEYNLNERLEKVTETR